MFNTKLSRSTEKYRERAENQAKNRLRVGQATVEPKQRSLQRLKPSIMWAWSGKRKVKEVECAS